MLGKLQLNQYFLIPITQKYIAKDYTSYDNKLFTIKNKPLLLELERKLLRILAFENNRKNYFRQHITDVKELLIKELESEKLK